MADGPRQAEQPDERKRTSRDQDDVLTGEREQVIEPRASEARLQAVAQPRVVAEHDSFEDRTAFSRETGCTRAPQPRAQAIGDAADSAPSADYVPLVDVQDDVDSLMPEPPTLVEAVLRAARRAHHGERADDGALRGRTAEGQVELDPLGDCVALEGPHARRETLRVPPDARFARDDGDEPAGTADLRGEHAAVECVEARAAPPPREDEHEHRRRRQRRRPVETKRHESSRRGADQCTRRPDSSCVRERESGHCGADHDVRGQDTSHGTASPFRSAIRAGPIPGIASRASTEVNGPCCCR